nr:hypothetical protein [Tanacetum cinerariifolium]
MPAAPPMAAPLPCGLQPRWAWAWWLEMRLNNSTGIRNNQELAPVAAGRHAGAAVAEGAIGRHQYFLLVLAAAAGRSAGQVVVNELVGAMLAGYQPGFGTHQPKVEASGRRKPVVARVISQRVEQVEQQRRGHIGTCEGGAALAAKVAYPHPDGIIAVVADAPGVAAAVASAGFPSNARQVAAAGRIYGQVGPGALGQNVGEEVSSGFAHHRPRVGRSFGRAPCGQRQWR